MIPMAGIVEHIERRPGDTGGHRRHRNRSFGNEWQPAIRTGAVLTTSVREPRGAADPRSATSRPTRAAPRRHCRAPHRRRPRDRAAGRRDGPDISLTAESRATTPATARSVVPAATSRGRRRRRRGLRADRRACQGDAPRPVASPGGTASVDLGSERRVVVRHPVRVAAEPRARVPHKPVRGPAVPAPAPDAADRSRHIG